MCEVNSVGVIHLPTLEINNVSGIIEVDEKDYILKNVILESNLGTGEIDYVRKKSL